MMLSADVPAQAGGRLPEDGSESGTSGLIEQSHRTYSAVDAKIPECRVGTSGWNYREWRGEFYPTDLQPRRSLTFYSERFPTVELNYCFYCLPDMSMYRQWSNSVPEGFVFSLKASRFLTHIKRLGDIRSAWIRFCSHASALNEKLGPILFQFPPSFHATPTNLKRIETFLRYRVTRQFRIAMEFRHQSCLGVDMYALLQQYGAAIVVSHSSRYPIPSEMVTAPFVYFRFHGPEAMFASPYGRQQIAEWAARIKSLLAQGRDVYAYFNNDSGGHAFRNAHALKALLDIDVTRD